MGAINMTIATVNEKCSTRNYAVPSRRSVGATVMRQNHGATTTTTRALSTTTAAAFRFHRRLLLGSIISFLLLLKAYVVQGGSQNDDGYAATVIARPADSAGPSWGTAPTAETAGRGGGAGGAEEERPLLDRIMAAVWSHTPDAFSVVADGKGGGNGGETAEERGGRGGPPSYSSSRLLDPPDCERIGGSGSGGGGGGHNRLECFLWNLHVPIPPQSFKKEFVTISVHDMVCTNIQLFGVETAYSKKGNNTTTTTRATSTTSRPDSTRKESDDDGGGGEEEEEEKERDGESKSGHTAANLHVSIRQVYAVCNGKYHSTGGLSGDVQASVSGQPGRFRNSGGNDGNGDSDDEQNALQAVFSIDSSKSQQSSSSSSTSSDDVSQPTAFRTTSCQLQLDVPWIDFSGSVSAKFIQLFAHTVSGYIVDALDGKICPLLSRKVDPLLTGYLHRFNAFCSQYLPKKQNEQQQPQQGDDDGEVLVEGREGSVTLGLRRGTTTAESIIPVITRKLQGDTKQSTGATSQSVANYMLVHWILTVFNEQLQSHLQKWWLPMPSNGESSVLPADCVDIFRGVSGWWASIFGNVTRIKFPPMLRRFVIPLPIDANRTVSVSVNLSLLDVAGIDAMDALQVLAPLPGKNASGYGNQNTALTSTPRLLQTRLESLQGFYVVAPVELEISQLQPVHPRGSEKASAVSRGYDLSPIRESFQVVVNMTNIAISIDAIMDVIDWDDTSLLLVVDAVQNFTESLDVHDLDCLVQTLYDVRIPTGQDDGGAEAATLIAHVVVNSIELSRSKRDVPDGSLEADLDRAFNAVVELALHEYGDLWTALVQGLAQGPGRRALNRWVRDWIESHSRPSDSTTDEGPHLQRRRCPTPPRNETPKWVNFTKFEILNKLNLFLDHSHTKRTMDHFLRCFGDTVDAYVKDPSPSVDDTARSKKDNGAVESDTFPLVKPPSTPFPFVSTLFDSGVNLLPSDGNDNISFRRDHENDRQRVILSKIETLHWDSLDQVQLIKPSADTRLNSSLIFGHPRKVDIHETSDASATMAPQVTFTVDMDGPKVVGQVNLTVFASLEATVEVQIDYDLNRLENLTIAHLLEQGDCVLVPAIEIRLLPGSTGVQFGKHLGVNLTAILNDKHVFLSTQDYPNLPQVSNQILDWSLEWVRSVFNMGIQEWMGFSVNRCPGVISPPADGHSGENHTDQGSSFWTDASWWLIALATVVMVQGGLVWVAQSMMPQNHKLGDCGTCDVRLPGRTESYDPFLSSYKELVNPFSGIGTRSGDEADVQIKSAVELDHEIMNELCEDLHDMYAPLHAILEDQLLPPISQQKPQVALFATKRISESARYLIPTAILLTIVLLISSNVSIGASVDMYLTVGRQFWSIPGLFKFSLGNTASDLYNAGIYPLLFLVVCFSGIWPYAKLLWMLRCWMKPNEDRYQRERRLLMLDALGKFSLVDTYVLILFVVAFRFHLDFSESLGIDVYVTPTYGFYSFLLATCLSLLVGHAMLFFHRNDTRPQCDTVNFGRRESILEHHFQVDDVGPPKRFARIIHVLLLGGLISALVLLTIGFDQESFTFEFGGLAGIALGDDNNTTSYSVLSLGAAIPQSVDSPGTAGIYFLEGAYFFFTMIMPILCIFVLMILLVCPMTVRWQRFFLVMAEITNAWSAIEVFLLSIVAALLQISSFASFMVGDKCEAIDRLAAEILYDRDEEVVCFTVDATVQPNCWYLIVGALTNSFLVSFCLRFVHSAVDERTMGALGMGALDGHDRSSLSTMNDKDLLSCNWTRRLSTMPIIGEFLFVAVDAPTTLRVHRYEVPFEQTDEIDDESDALSSQ